MTNPLLTLKISNLDKHSIKNSIFILKIEVMETYFAHLACALKLTATRSLSTFVFFVVLYLKINLSFISVDPQRGHYLSPEFYLRKCGKLIKFK